MISFNKKLWIGLLVLSFLTPLGIILPRALKAGDAWGEWGAEELQRLLGYLPEGLKRMAGLWKAPLPDYSVGGEQTTLVAQSGAYVLSAVIGVVLVAVIMYLLSRLLVKQK